MSMHVRRTVLFGDCDPAGFIYTPRISHFVVEAILAFQTFRLAGSAARKILELGVLPPAKSMSIDFLAPLVWDDEIDMEVKCTRVGRTSFTCEVTARRQDNEVAFRAELTQVCVSPQTKRPVELPTPLRKALLSDL